MQNSKGFFKYLRHIVIQAWPVRNMSLYFGVVLMCTLLSSSFIAKYRCVFYFAFMPAIEIKSSPNVLFVSVGKREQLSSVMNGMGNWESMCFWTEQLFLTQRKFLIP